MRVLQEDHVGRERLDGCVCNINARLDGVINPFTFNWTNSTSTAFGAIVGGEGAPRYAAVAGTHE